MKIDSEELTNYVASVLEGIHSSKNPVLKDYSVSQGVSFDLKVVHKKEAGGGLKILIANAEGKYEQEVVSRITFTMQNKETMNDGLNAFVNALKKFSEIDEKPKLKQVKK